MEYRLLGRTGLNVSKLCFGCMTFGGRGMWVNIGTQGQDEANNLVARALDAGINFFDTAEIYSDGESEKLLGKALGARRKDAIIATKVAGRTQRAMRPDAGPNHYALTRHHIMEAIDASLKRLGTDYVDLYQLHAQDHDTPLDETLHALEDIVRAGKVRYIGVSNHFAWQIMKGLGISKHHAWARFESVQAHYSLAARELEREIIPLLADQHLSLLVWSPLAGGLLTDKFAGGAHPEGARRTTFDFPPVDKERAFKCIDVMKEIAPRYDADVARIALAWLLHQRTVTSVIIGTKTLEQLEDDLKAAEIQLSPEDLKRLDEVSAIRPEYPAWMRR